MAWRVCATYAPHACASVIRFRYDLWSLKHFRRVPPTYRTYWKNRCLQFEGYQSVDVASRSVSPQCTLLLWFWQKIQALSRSVRLITLTFERSLLALSVHRIVHRTCQLSGLKRTLR